MPKNLLIVSAIAAVAVIGLFLLPKSVVDNENSTEANAAEEATGIQAGEAEHSMDVPNEAIEELAELKEAYQNSKNSENFASFANSLIERFASLNQYDSAAKYAAELAEFNQSEANLQKAGDMYYEAFTFAMDADKTRRMGEQARYFYEQLLAQSPDHLDAKAKMAMTYVSSPNPMQGILMLREVLDTDANNQMAIYNLGLLSMQSGQYDRAIDRFEKLVTLDPEHLQAQFLLGVSYFNAGKNGEAEAQFKKVKTMDADPSVAASVDEYLNQL